MINNSTISRKKILYGAGTMGKRAFEYYTKDCPDAVYCFVDDMKGGSEYCGRPVISFEELLTIYHNYDIVVCVFYLFDILVAFDKAKIHSYKVWEDSFLVPQEERYANFYKLLDQFEKPFLKQKIIYGAGDYGERAFYYFGSERVFAFADAKKGGTTYLGKLVLWPSELVDLCQDYDIVVCVKLFSQAAEYLEILGVKFRIFSQVDDVRAEDTLVYKDTLLDDRVRGELKALDFIANPEYIREYNRYLVNLTRRVNAIKDEQSRTLERFIEENRFYGFFEEMIKYAKRDLEYYEAPSISHGFLIDMIPYTLNWYNLLEPGVVSEPVVHSICKDCLCFICGPYMHYTEPYYSDVEALAYKKRLGRNLTVFPVHSLPTTKVEYDYQSFVNFVLHDAKQFDSLTICTHYSDFDNEITRLFKSQGANIVSAGFTFDPSFIRRLKSIISASDAIITNGLGSHINNCLSLNKPVKFFSQKIRMHSIVDSNTILEKYYGANKTDYGNIFLSNEYKLTQKQLDLYEPSTGFSKVKTQEEMGVIFDLSKRIIQSCNYKRSKYIDSIRSTYRELQRSIAEPDKLQFRLMREALPADYEAYLNRLGV